MNKVGGLYELKKKVMFAARKDGSVSASSDGPSVEVVITQQTKIYRDTTFETHEPVDGQKVQQTVKPMQESEIQKNDIAAV